MADTIRSIARLAYDNVTQSDTLILIQSNDSTVYIYQKTDTDRWQREKKIRGRGYSRDGSVDSGDQRGNYLCCTFLYNSRYKYLSPFDI